MNKRLSVQKCIMFGVLLSGFQGAFAAASDFTDCPSVDVLKTFEADYSETSPISFDIHNNTVKMSIIKKQWTESGSMNFILSSVTVSAGQDPEDVGRSLVNTLQQDNTTPVMFRVNDSLTIPVCSYSSPDNDQIKGMVFYGPDRPDPFVK